jgi:hypothetical protein
MIIVGNANVRRGPLKHNFESVLNRAAKTAGIHRIRGTSFANEPLRRINTSNTLPISTWGTYPSRADGPGADMTGEDDTWQRLNPNNGEFEFRSGDSSWRTGTERHDTGLAIDCYLQVYKDGKYRPLLPSNNADLLQISKFLTSFAEYGGRGCGVGSNGSRYMKNGLFHLDMLGAPIKNAAKFIQPTGFSKSNIIGWNSRPCVWGYGGANTKWAKAALDKGFKGNNNVG